MDTVQATAGGGATLDKETTALILTEIPSLRRFARYLARDNELAEDLVQDTLARAVAKIAQWQPGTNMRAWLMAILRSNFISHHRYVRRRPQCESLDDRMYELGDQPRQAIRLDLMSVSKACRGLPAEQQEVLRLIAVDGMKYEEAAERLGVPIGTVRSRLFRARTAITTYMQPAA
jgi:RNA polymerase sigma-70 factor (ECF subfamily)